MYTRGIMGCSAAENSVCKWVEEGNSCDQSPKNQEACRVRLRRVFASFSKLQKFQSRENAHRDVVVRLFNHTTWRED